MTRFVRINIDLQHVGSEFQMHVPDFESFAADIASPTGAMFKTHWRIEDGQALATSVSADITLPHAVCPPNIALGTSVFAAGRVGLELARIALARTRLPKHMLDRISVEHVSVCDTSISYLLPFPHEGLAKSFKKLIRQHGALLGLRITTSHANSRTEYRIAHGSGSAAPELLTDLVGAAVLVDFRPTQDSVAQSFVCIDALLNEDYLKRHDWTALSGWDIRHARDRYELVFKRLVRGILQLDVPSPYYPEPDESALTQLGPRHELLLREYLAGGNPKSFSGFPAKFPNLFISQEKGWKVARKAIIEQTGIDINISWEHYQRSHRPSLLIERLVYPGDYSLPPKASADSHFCAQSWPSILNDLHREYSSIL